MRNLFKKSPEIRLTFKEWVFGNNYGWKWEYLKQIGNNPIIITLSNLCIYFDWFGNNNKFKSGDRVKYNLFARANLHTLEEMKKGKFRKVYTFICYPEWSKSKSNCEYKDENGNEGGCAVYWLRKAYFWEI